MAKSWVRDAVVVDFETLPIGERPEHPPVPVGVAIHTPSTKPKYYAFGHLDGNTSNFSEARAALAQVWESGRPVLGHNLSRFDLDVAETYFGLDPLPWQRVHDTLPMLFLRDPRAESFGLKPSAEALLGIAPDERDAVEEWLIENQPVPGHKLSRSKKSDYYAGAHIAFAPPSLVGPYAIGDCTRTRDLAAAVWKEIVGHGMEAPYEVERELAPHVLAMERQGLRVALDRLGADLDRYESVLAKLEGWLRERIGAPEDLNLDSSQQLANALIGAGLCAQEDLGLTDTGKMATNKEALKGAVNDSQVLAVLKYRAQLKTCLQTFMRPWHAVAVRSHGFIYTTWNSTRSDRGATGSGARTGRFSSTPNFMNIPNEFPPIFFEEGGRLPREVRAKLPKMPFRLPPLPKMRSYILPYADGDVLADRDYSQQEPRILAHYEDGALADAYRANPWVDYHDNAKAALAAVGVNLERKQVKIINLAIIYGMGIGHMAEQIGKTVEETKGIRDTILRLYPGLKQLYATCKDRARQGKPIRTWGGREYYCEAPKEVRGRMMSFDYKLPNVLIQGSAADCTKQAMLRYFRAKPAHHRLLVTVHDELLASMPARELDEGMECLRESMESVPFDVPMLSEGEWSDKSWEDLEPYDKKGKRVV